MSIKNCSKDVKKGIHSTTVSRAQTHDTIFTYMAVFFLKTWHQKWLSYLNQYIQFLTDLLSPYHTWVKFLNQLIQFLTHLCTWELVFIIIVQFMMSANIRIHFGLQIVLVCLYSTPSHYHHCAKLSEGIELIECLSDVFCQVCKIKHILSVIHYTTCGAVCFQLTHSSCDDWENIYIYIYILCLIIIIKSKVWTITHSLGLGHETMVCAVCLSIFLQ